MPIQKIKCCYLCEKRSAYCHASCADYIVEKVMHDAEREFVREKREIEMGVYDERTKRVEKCYGLRK